MRCRIWNLVEDEDGVATVEYAMLLAVVVVATIGAWIGLGAKVKTAIINCTNSISLPPP